MLEDIYKIGLIAQKRKNQIMDSSIIPDKIAKMDKVYSIDFDENFKYIGIGVNDFIEEVQHQYLLRKNSSNGINFGPTAQITELEKTLEKKIIPWFNTLGSNMQIENAKKIYEEINNNKDIIIEEMQKDYVKKLKSLMTIKINEKFPYDIPWIFESYGKLVKDKMLGNDMNRGNCYICKKKDVEIVPGYRVYKFHTKDKPGFIAGGFQEKDFWRNCPVCTECQPIINNAKQFVEENLKYRYYGLTYNIIPSTLGNIDTLEEILDILASNEVRKQTLAQEAKEAFEFDNENILYALKDANNINSFRLFFVQKSNSEERILLDIKDMYPNRFKEMYNAKEKIDSTYYDILKFINKEKQIERIKFNFSFFREFLSKSDDKNTDNDLNKIFLGLTESIFYKNKIKLETILIHIMRKLRRFLDEEEIGRLNISTLKAMAGIQYLINIGCLEEKEGDLMETEFDEIFEKYQFGLDNNLKRALVLVGALVQKVMNIQYKEISSTPFSKNLKSLRLREEEVKGLVAQAVNKMQEYDCYSSKSQEIVKEISKLIFMTKNDWKLSVDEINFYIVAGMSLQKEIYGEKKGEMKDE